MEEHDDVYSGEGIKKIKAYKCTLLINELQALRSEFWASHKESRTQWLIVQRACETDCATAELILSNSGLVCLEGNMKCIVDSNSGLVFNVPNFCINDPYFKKEYLSPEDIPEKDLNKYEITISNKQSGLNLKNIFYEKEGLSSEEYKVRLLYKGGEIKDEDLLAIYNFDKHPQVQVACNKIEPIEEEGAQV